MIKRTIFISNPTNIFKKNNQLILDFPDRDKDSVSIPIEDIGILILDNYNIKLTLALITALQSNNAVIINCDEKHLPQGVMLPFWTHSNFTERLWMQMEASEPLKKNLWQQTVAAKITNQAYLLNMLDVECGNMLSWSKKVKSGDPENLEARAASWYWEHLFGEDSGFRRKRFGEAPNNLLNYGYAILRAVVARSLVGSGLLPALGIHHSNRANAFCLADDVMEPYRPFVDQLVLEIMDAHEEFEDLTPSIKKELLQIPAITVTINHNKSPLMVALQQTTASLAACLNGEIKRIKYPGFYESNDNDDE